MKNDVAVLNLWWSVNYGAILTAFAIQEVLKNSGYNAVFVKYLFKSFEEGYVNSFSKRFAEKYFRTTQSINDYNELKDLNKFFETFVVGSDQIWRSQMTSEHKNTYFLDFVEDNKKMISIAASFGIDDFVASDEKKSLIGYHLSRFEAVSVREKSGIDVCLKSFDIEANHIIDPVFLCDKKHYEKLIDSSKIMLPKKCLTTYVLDKLPEIIKEIKIVAEKRELEIYDINNKEKIEVEDWLNGIKNCDLFITDSFHGICFAIIFQKEFICLANIGRGLSRFESILGQLNLMDRIVFDCKDFNKKDFVSIDWGKVNLLLTPEIEQGLSFVKNALVMPIKSKKTARNFPKIKNKKIKIFLYRLLSKFLFGECRGKYKQKYKDLRDL